MEENKYYTPAIEDFHIGYEFEIKNRSFKNTSNAKMQGVITGEWRHAVCNHFYDPASNNYTLDNVYHTLELIDNCQIDPTPQIRTPYLTAEQIVTEGQTTHEKWILVKENDDQFFMETEIMGTFFKLSYDKIYHKLLIQNRNHNPVTFFRGQCPSINEFRTIMKMICV